MNTFAVKFPTSDPLEIAKQHFPGGNIRLSENRFVQYDRQILESLTIWYPTNVLGKRSKF